MWLDYPVSVGASGATLLWQTVDGDAEGTSPPINPSANIFRCGDAGKGGLPLMLVVPTNVTVMVGVAAGATTGGAPITGPIYLPLNPIGNDAMYGYCSSTQTVHVLVGNQRS
jgi:hypothetical protein